MQKIRPVINHPLIKVITGMRRVGKSTLLQLIQDELRENGVNPEKFINLNFEIMGFESLRDYHELYAYITSRLSKDAKYYIFLDEIQEVESFEKVINSINLEFDVDIYITGSNSKLLSGELASVLTGRFYSIEVYPLSFQEIVSAKGAAALDADFIDYINNGGLPAIQGFEQPGLVKGYLSDVASSILLKDIVMRYAIRDVDLLDRFLRYVYQNVGQIFSASSITKFLKAEGRNLSKETIYNYLDACKSAYLIHGAPRFDIKGKQILKTNEKYFVNDLGIRSIYFSNETDISQALENVVYLELRRRGYTVYVGEIDKREVDFIAVKNTEKIYVQVTYLLASDETLEREFSALELIRDNYLKVVISMDKIKRERNGIKHLNIIEFLLDDAIG
jgi:hypothetical protein